MFKALSCLLLTSTSAIAANLIPADLEYLGAFRLPGPGDGPTTWAYGGQALTYYPDGDPGGDADGFPGSLFGSGHVSHDRVSEISIPVPAIPASFDAAGFSALPVAQTLQAFADLTGGIRQQVGVDQFGGLAYLPARPGQSSGKLYWTIYEYYNVAAVDYPSHGWSELNLAAPMPAGAWHLGPQGDPAFHSMRTARYVFDVPQDWADIHLDGLSLISGRHREAGCCGSSQGPPMYAFAPWRDGQPPGSPPSHLARLSSLQLVHYPAGGGHFPAYRACDDWSGGAFLTRGADAAVLVVGRKSLGEARYGLGQPGDCGYGTQGYHCDPYEPQFLFYSPEDLAAVAAGGMQPWQVLPYAILRPQAYLWPSCGWHLGGSAFDRQRGLFYVVQHSVLQGQPLVHVFRLGNGDALFADGFEQAGVMSQE